MPTINQEHLDKLQKYSSLLLELSDPSSLTRYENRNGMVGVKDWLSMLRREANLILWQTDTIYDENKDNIPGTFEYGEEDAVLDNWYYLWDCWCWESSMIKKEQEDEGYYRIEFPFEDCLGYPIFIWLKQQDNGEFYITDRGRTLYHLVKADTIEEGFTSIIDKILYRRDVTLNAKTWEIFSIATMNNLPKTIIRLLSGILAVDSWGLAFEDMKLDRCCTHH